MGAQSGILPNASKPEGRQTDRLTAGTDRHKQTQEIEIQGTEPEDTTGTRVYIANQAHNLPLSHIRG